MIPDRVVLRLLPAALEVWRRRDCPTTGAVFALICRAWEIEDRRARPEDHE